MQATNAEKARIVLMVALRAEASAAVARGRAAMARPPPGKIASIGSWLMSRIGLSAPRPPRDLIDERRLIERARRLYEALKVARPEPRPWRMSLPSPDLSPDDRTAALVSESLRVLAVPKVGATAPPRTVAQVRGTSTSPRGEADRPSPAVPFRTPVGRPRAPMAVSVPAGQVIHLPVPFGMWDTAERHGALRDLGSPKGVSPWYVPVGADLEPFRGMLPSMFDGRAPPGPFVDGGIEASYRNIPGLFSRDTWDHVRRSAYAMTGNRCSTCGRVGRNGYVARTLFQDGSRDRVDCHEVWSRNVEDDVLVQRLETLAVLCVDCHAAFHKGYFVGKAGRIGKGAQMENFLNVRRAAIAHVDQAGLRALVARQEASMRPAPAGLRVVVDLSWLGAQQFMASRIPILVEHNRSRTSPADVVGIDFETDAGMIYETQSPTIRTRAQAPLFVVSSNGMSP